MDSRLLWPKIAKKFKVTTAGTAFLILSLSLSISRTLSSSLSLAHSVPTDWRLFFKGGVVVHIVQLNNHFVNPVLSPGPHNPQKHALYVKMDVSTPAFHYTLQC